KQEDSEPVPELELFTGESRVFSTPGVARIVVGNGQVITANALDDKDIIIFANGVGTSTLFVWNQQGRFQRIKVTVLATDMGRYLREVATFLAAIPKAKASVVGDKVIVEGEELSDADRDKV
ncbi:pilus assembly protein N-terminal domain-containing protein, partial [Undibacterium sp. SXout7W]|uniref:pilus assembly protein N-terminal domain-containing protein n=1 Tax=Undibacterium sp. SXout7W TaxID=3413049 RepID=UPI003BF1251C